MNRMFFGSRPGRKNRKGIEWQDIDWMHLAVWNAVVKLLVAQQLGWFFDYLTSYKLPWNDCCGTLYLVCWLFSYKPVPSSGVAHVCLCFRRHNDASSLPWQPVPWTSRVLWVAIATWSLLAKYRGWEKSCRKSSQRSAVITDCKSNKFVWVQLDNAALTNLSFVVPAAAARTSGRSWCDWLTGWLADRTTGR